MDELNPLEQAVYDLIPRGIENSKTRKEMNTHLKDRSFKRIISALRSKGKIIGAVRRKENGYYVATTEEEKEIAIASFEAQPKREMEIASIMRNAELEEIK